MESKIILAKNINMDKNYINVLSYNENQVLELLNSTEHFVASNNKYSFIQPSSIFVEFTYNQCLQSNYIAFQNPAYSNKWYFAFIDDVIYKGDRNTEIKFTIDAWTTWFQYWNTKECFVQREHVIDDTIGINTIPENLNVGEVIEEDFEEYLTFGENNNDYYFVIEGTYNPINKKDFVGVNKINGILNGNWIFLFDVYSGSVGIPDINNFLADINGAGKIDSIKNIYILPKWICDNIGTTDYNKSSTFGSYSFKLLNSNDDIVEVGTTFNIIKNFKDYKPKNNKVFVYPYNYMLISNNVGNYNIYKYEDFYSENPLLTVEGSASVGGSVRLVPRNYKNIDKNYDESLPLAKFPTCSWSSDAFTNWLVSNAVNLGSQVMQLGTGVATGNVGTVASSISNLIGQFYQASLLPSIQGGNNTGDVNFSARKNTFSIHHMRAKTEYLKIIDDYFTRFGYQINRVKKPNIFGRQYWNYIEIGQNEDIGYGEVPPKYMEIINNACRKGITIWHNHNNIGNYNLDNKII